MSKRGMFSAEFKHGAVEQTKQPGVSCAQVARELGIRENLSAFMTLEVSPHRD
jgi:transposase